MIDPVHLREQAVTSYEYGIVNELRNDVTIHVSTYELRRMLAPAVICMICVSAQCTNLL